MKTDYQNVQVKIVKYILSGPYDVDGPLNINMYAFFRSFTLTLIM